MATEQTLEDFFNEPEPVTKEYELAPPPADKWKPQPKIKAVGMAGFSLTAFVSSIIILMQKMSPDLTFTADEMGAIMFLTACLFWVIQTAVGYLIPNR